MDLKTLNNIDLDKLETLSAAELQKILDAEIRETNVVRGQIKSKMLEISRDMKKYDISTGGVGSAIKFDGKANIKRQLIDRIRSARSYRLKLNKQFAQISNISARNILQNIITGFDNINVSKQVEILRNLGYSEEQIDYILTKISGDEDYDELKEKAEDAMVEWYQENGETTDNIDDVVRNPYAL